MKNELMVFHSCGHVIIEEVEDAVFDRFTQQPGHGPLGELEPCKFRVGRTRRRAYVHPARFSNCESCMAWDL